MEHAAERFGGTPEELITYGEGAEVVVAHLHLPQATYRNGEATGDGCGREAIQCGFFAVFDNVDPVVIFS